MSEEILDVDLLAFEQGSAGQRRAVVDGVMRSLATGFVYARHDLSTQMLDETYALLADFFHLPTEAKQRYVAEGSQGQTGYTGLLVETAAASDTPDWKEMLNWGRSLPEGHPLRAKDPYRYGPPMLPDHDLPGATDRLLGFHDALVGLQTRFLRIIAIGLGAHESFFDSMLVDGPHLTRAIRYPPMPEAPSGGHVWAYEHGDINLITARPRATARGLQVRTDSGWIDAVPPDDHVIINTGIMLEHLSNGLIPIGWHRVVAHPDQPGERISVVQFCHPTPWTVLTPMPATITPDNPQRFSSIGAEDRLQQVLYEINLFEAARRVEGS